MPDSNLNRTYRGFTLERSAATDWFWIVDDPPVYLAGEWTDITDLQHRIDEYS